LFSIKRIKNLFSYGWKILCSGLLDTIYNNLYGLIIGRVYNSELLGYYNRGDQFPKILVLILNGSISSVLLPALSIHQEDHVRVKSMVRISIMISSFVILPMMIGLAACAESLVRILLTDKWVPAVPFLQFMCFSYALWPIHTANLQAIKALGCSGTYLKLEIIKKCLGLAILCISMPFGIYAMAGSMVITSVIGTFINAAPNRELLGYSYKEQWRDIMPSIILALIMGVVIYNIMLFKLSACITLIFQVVVGFTLYVGLAYIFKLECLMYLLKNIKGLVERRYCE
jgi:O-antigen/teichoic acid export membrane protein